MKNNSTTKLINLILPALCAVIITVCAWITVPTAVPFTMQTFAVFLVTGLFGSRCAVLSLVIYAALGAVGLPVFSGFGSGISAIIGPTGGYMLGFFAIPLASWVIKRIFSDSALTGFIAGTVGLLLCYLFGTVWFVAVYTKSGGDIGIFKALTLCVLPFIIPDLVKLSLAVFLSRRLSPVIAGLRK